MAVCPKRTTLAVRRVFRLNEQLSNETLKKIIHGKMIMTFVKEQCNFYIRNYLLSQRPIHVCWTSFQHALVIDVEYIPVFYIHALTTMTQALSFNNGRLKQRWVIETLATYSSYHSVQTFEDVILYSHLNNQKTENDLLRYQ